MAREIQLLLDNNLSSFAFKKVSRNDLYGFKKRIPLGMDSMSVKIEDPVVEYPEIVSKKASVILGITPENK